MFGCAKCFHSTATWWKVCGFVSVCDRGNATSRTHITAILWVSPNTLNTKHTRFRQDLIDAAYLSEFAQRFLEGSARRIGDAVENLRRF